jgi:hypothetical protein
VGFAYEARADGVEPDVLDHRGELFLALDHARREAIAEQVSRAAMADVEALSVDTVEPAQPV